jgi:hypothetical protein
MEFMSSAHLRSKNNSGEQVTGLKLDAGVMEAITKGPAFGDRKLHVTCICLIVKNPRAHNYRTIGVTTMKRELDV